MNKYDEQAKDFLKSTNTTFKADFLKNDFYFDGDKETRDIYKIILKRGNRKYVFNFGQSINDSGFFYTKGVQKIDINRKHLNKSDEHIVKIINDYNFLNNGKSDVIIKPTRPTPYNVLSCLTKYNPETFENFCDEYGYDEDSIKAKKVYDSVVDEYRNVIMLWNDSEIEQLAEIN